jgi:hypothetical protein
MNTPLGALSMRGLLFNVVGALLVLAGIGLVAVTARGQSNYRAAAGRHGGEVIDLGANATPQPAQHGYMARVVGTPRVVEAPRDPEFNLRADTPVLMRHVEMFQWREIRIGDDVHYELDWEERSIDSGGFREPSGHANPGNFPISGKQFDAGLVQVGGFRLSPPLLHAMSGSVRVMPDLKSLPANLAASFSQSGGYLTTSVRPDDPRLGDLRVSWDEVPLQQSTIVARIDGDRLVPASDAADGKGYELEVGDVPLLDMFPDLPVPPDSVPVRQVLAVLLAALGALVLFAVDGGRRDPLLALAVGCLVVGAVASVMWLGSDMRLAGGWLLLTLLGMAVAIWRLRHGHRAAPRID